MNIKNKIQNIQIQTKHYLYEDTAVTEQMPKFDSSQFFHINVLGTGSFGYVVQSKYIDDNKETTYALKILAKDSIKKVEHIIEEIYILKILKHPFIIKLEGTFQTSDQLCMVFELLLYGDLYKVVYDIVELPTLPFDLVLFYFSSLVIVLDYIHNKGIIHRDLKPENIMLDEKGYIKLVDMGLSKRIRYVNEYTKENGEVVKQMVDEKTYTLCGTPEYLSPEILISTGYDKSTDIWSLGILTYELFMKKMPFKSNNDMILLFTNIVNVYRKGFNLTDDVKKIIQNENMEDLLVELLNGHRDKRIGVKEGTLTIFNHKLFTEYKNIINDITNRTYIPSYIPNKLEENVYEQLTTLPNIKPFKGDNSLFINF